MDKLCDYDNQSNLNVLSMDMPISCLQTPDLLLVEKRYLDVPLHVQRLRKAPRIWRVDESPLVSARHPEVPIPGFLLDDEVEVEAADCGTLPKKARYTGYKALLECYQSRNTPCF